MLGAHTALQCFRRATETLVLELFGDIYHPTEVEIVEIA